MERTGATGISGSLGQLFFTRPGLTWHIEATTRHSARACSSLSKSVFPNTYHPDTVPDFFFLLVMGYETVHNSTAEAPGEPDWC